MLSIHHSYSQIPAVIVQALKVIQIPATTMLTVGTSLKIAFAQLLIVVVVIGVNGYCTLMPC
jgi:hypothetical protein